MPRRSATVDQQALQSARAIYDAFRDYQSEFNALTRRARSRFENGDWHGNHGDVLERLELYPAVVGRVLPVLRDLLGDGVSDENVFQRVKRAYSSLIIKEHNAELAQTFFNSVTRQTCGTVGVNPAIEFLPVQSALRHAEPDPRICRRYAPNGATQQLIAEILHDYDFSVPYRDLANDARLVAREVDRFIAALPGGGRIDGIETLRSVFFRHKGAYIMGRIRCGDRWLPLVLPVRGDDHGLQVDAVLMDEDDVSILFSFARSHFHVEAECPRDLAVFLKSVMPLKPIAELYISLGFNRHGKTELYRSLQGHLSKSHERFQFADGARGMVMLVFSLPHYDVVFKVIRDRFQPPKTNTRKEVMGRYRLVFQWDRVGRLVDAQEFDHLKFRREMFSEELLRELTDEAGETVSVRGEEVVIGHLYTERKVTPLNLFIDDVDEATASRAIVDYGDAIRELAAANIFPGDFLLKNFGVTRHGRVVFYDYDELCLVTDCNFRELPTPRNPDEELEADPWFTVGDHDIFPEEFRKFLGLGHPLREVFIRHHEDLFTAEFWRGLQLRHRAGEILDFYPYPQSKRLHR